MKENRFTIHHKHFNYKKHLELKRTEQKTDFFWFLARQTRSEFNHVSCRMRQPPRTASFLKIASSKPVILLVRCCLLIDTSMELHLRLVTWY